ncbi:NADH-quinone oxidoreductase subunit C [Methanoculleus palmolei]|jgi:formate hydrogenlyase subunit 5|uniref:NADH-quinone oxidoreductase subunit C n=1 Tax=Methanoculleus palmolei TaxID=72612 RepID=A0ABD8A8M5_9EURY|nr:NADH-quinone oxidoreductase subunit C [Methanoculleus sp. UBA377]WOX55470.1 NADH-quinone oxidoreductase subunit C [Methanoculleus palmolei]
MSEKKPSLEVTEIPADKISAEVSSLLNRGARMLYASGVDMGVPGIRIDYYFTFDDEIPGRNLALRTFVNRKKPVIESVTPITTQADWAEREMIEFLGVEVKNHPDPRHLWLPLNWEDMHTSTRQQQDPRSERIDTGPTAHPPHDNIFTKQLSVVPYGPYHPALIESNYLKMSVEDEIVRDADLKLGFNHRSIIKLMERRDYYKDLFLAERICGFCNVHHSLTFAQAVEEIGGIAISKKARYVRTLLGEMERMKSHILAIGLMGDLAGFRTMLMHAIRIREDILDSLEVMSGQRISHGIITLGGIRNDVTPVHTDVILSKLQDLKKSVPEYFDQCLANDVFTGRLRTIGVLTPDAARESGAVGPIARGSGLNLDIRKNLPYAAYEDVDWDVVTENGGDCFARMQVRMREVLMSLHICEQCCDVIRSSPSEPVPLVHELPCGEGFSRTEPPRGELLYHVASNGTNTPDFVRLRVPTFPNVRIMLNLIKGSTIGDVPVIIGSIDPCFSCTDRVTTLTPQETVTPGSEGS